MKSLLILGRQPALGLAELESLYGATVITPVRSAAALLDISPEEVAFERLGGSIKLTRVLATLPSADWREVENYLTHHIPGLLEQTPEGKLRLGLSTYGLRVRPGDINATGLRLKKIIKNSGRSVRVVPNKSAALNSAQVFHNQLTASTGMELVIVAQNRGCVIARTVAEQDIEAYARRDQERPLRDAKVGMLPPKLAQLLINLAKPAPGATVLDPFCGTGVVLQEAKLMGLIPYGTDLEPRMIDYSRGNLHCLFGKSDWKLEVGDATTHAWQPFDTVTGETFLGKPLSSLPPRHILDAIQRECDDIHDRFLRNIGSQAKSGTVFCLAVPAWRLKNGFLHLKTLDHLEKIGYTRLSFVHARTEELVYHRPDQTVARELVVLVKN